jgi:mono/diheme cytochrome c family protein
MKINFVSFRKYRFTISAFIFLIFIFFLLLPHLGFSHSGEKQKHDLENLDKTKPEGMIHHHEGEQPKPGDEYMEPEAPKDAMDHSHDMHHGHGDSSGDPFLTRGKHDLSNMDDSLGSKGKALLARGRNIYLHMCVFCHGKDGNGGGTAMEYLYPWPRDFRKGIFKFRSTPTNTLPKDSDIYRTIIRGIPGTSMPAWGDALSPQDTWALVNLIKSFSPRFKEASPGEKVNIGEPPVTNKEMIARGAEVFKKNKCSNCHGESGKGDGKLAQSLKDAWNHAVFVHDITNPAYFKAGYDPKTIFRTLSTGLDGTPMESYSHLPEADRWALVHFIRSRFEKGVTDAEFETDIRSYKIDFEITTDPFSKIWEGVKTTELVLRPLSARRQAVETINFSSVNNGKQMAFRLKWKDPTHSGFKETTGDTFRDGVAIQFGLGDVTLHTHGHNEPFFGMGNRGKPVTIWHWKAGLQETLEASEDTEYATGGVDMDALIYGGTMSNPVHRLNPTDESAVEELNAEGFGTITPQRPENQDIQGYGEWKDGEWTVVFLREMEALSKWDVDFTSKSAILAAFAVWDGEKEDRNGRKVISVWQRLNVDLEP